MILTVGRRKNDKRSKNIITREQTAKWLEQFKRKYYDIKENYFYCSFGENTALFAFIYFYLNCEFEDSAVADAFSGVMKYVDPKEFSKVSQEKTLKDIDEAISKVE